MTDLDKLLIGAMLAQVALTFALLILLGRARLPLVSSGQVPIADVALDREGWPERPQQVANAFDNQFQLPVLFYAGVLLALWAGAGWPEVALAWLFVALRIVHAAIHVTDNNVPRRFFAYTAGMVVLMAFWAWLVVKLLVLSPGVA